jgi:hypothetical protein
MAVLKIVVNKNVMDIWVVGKNRIVVKARGMNIVGNKVMHLDDKMVYEVVRVV